MLRHPPRTRCTRRLAAVVALLALGVPAAQADPTPAEEAVPEHAYRADGRPVDGGASLAQAPEITAGIHRDSLEATSENTDQEGTAAYYRIAVEDGQRVRAAATVSAPPYPDGLPEEREGLEVGVSFLTAAGDSCDDGGTEDVGRHRDGDGPITTSRVSDVVGPDGCAGGELFLRIVREGPRAMDTPVPVEFQVAVQPPGVGGGSPAVTEEIEDDGANPLAPEDTEPITPGRSHAAATPVEPGSSVVELVPGEVGLLSVEVAEGQRLRWRTEVTSAPEDPGSIALRVADAARSQVTVGGGSWRVNEAGQVDGGGMRAPVDRGNRSSEIDSVRSAWLPGTHTVMVQRPQRPADADPAGDQPVRLILTLEVEGQEAEDAPQGTVLELGETGPVADGGLGRVAMLGGAGVLVLMAGVSGVAGVLVLRLRRS